MKILDIGLARIVPTLKSKQDNTTKPYSYMLDLSKYGPADTELYDDGEWWMEHLEVVEKWVREILKYGSYGEHRYDVEKLNSLAMYYKRYIK